MKLAIKMQIILILLFCIICNNVKADTITDNITSPDTVFSTLENIYTNKVSSSSFFKNIKTYLSARQPNIYDKSFWSIAYIYDLNNLQKYEYVLPDKKIVMITFESNNLVRDYIIFKKPNNGIWTLTGMFTQLDRYLNGYGKCNYHLVTDTNSDNYWLVLETEVKHGSDLSIFNQIWYNPDGSEALQYEANGNALQFSRPDVNGIWYSAGIYFNSVYSISEDNSNICINVSYNIYFNYPSDSFIPIYRNYDNAFYYWQPEARKFMLNEEKSTLRSIKTNGFSNDYDLITQKYAYRESEPIKTQEAWIKVIKNMIYK